MHKQSMFCMSEMAVVAEVYDKRSTAILLKLLGHMNIRCTSGWWKVPSGYYLLIDGGVRLCQGGCLYGNLFGNAAATVHKGYLYVHRAIRKTITNIIFFQ